MQAIDFISLADKHMRDRAKTYDAAGTGERSIGKTVSMFNTLTGHGLTDEEGWIFMTLLKMVRSQQGEYKSDNYEDLVAYSALTGEAAHAARAPVHSTELD